MWTSRDISYEQRKHACTALLLIDLFLLKKIPLQSKLRRGKKGADATRTAAAINKSATYQQDFHYKRHRLVHTTLQFSPGSTSLG